MKKIFAIILTFALLSCCALAESADITGMWYFDMFGLVAAMELKADNTFALSFLGEEQTGTYTLDGADFSMTYEGDEKAHVGVYDAEAQTISVDDGQYVFGRDEIVPFVPASAREDSALADFAGSWECFKVGTQGMYIDPAGAGIALNAVIDGDSVTISLIYGTQAIEAPVTGTFAEGALTSQIIADDGAGNTNLLTFEMRLLEDGNLSAAFVEGGDITFYLAPVTEEIPAE